ncbi:unnamed protein product [Lepeophtheirus salmonis]|uniref:(salmon louse) hypothetical protein n=1 Tax=Lepeophtheirus salmonis TaxID=72036 RepID=A0A7R8CF29_LEPSM|nr:unnamed protein product [Lepeophtheirus salmonis]CAF2801956.1 unnamed protein product [Lepeophtheirus salmonis]
MQLMMLHEVNFNKLCWNENSEYNNARLQSLDDILIILQCNPPSIECYLRQWGICGDEIKNLLSQILVENIIDEITYRRWAHTDRSQLETLVKPSQDFVEHYTKGLQKYQPHVFVTKMQSSSLKERKKS